MGIGAAYVTGNAALQRKHTSSVGWQNGMDIPPTNSAEIAKVRVRMNVGATILNSAQAHLVKERKKSLEVGEEERRWPAGVMYRTTLD